MKWLTQTKAFDCSCAGKCWRRQKPLECREGSRGWSKFPGNLLTWVERIPGNLCGYHANEVRGVAAVGPTATVVVVFSRWIGRFKLVSPSFSEISYAANMPKEPFLVALASVFHKSGFFSTQPWPFKNSWASEKSFPSLLTWHFFQGKSGVREKVFQNPGKW